IGGDLATKTKARVQAPVGVITNQGKVFERASFGYCTAGNQDFAIRLQRDVFGPRRPMELCKDLATLAKACTEIAFLVIANQRDAVDVSVKASPGNDDLAIGL